MANAGAPAPTAYTTSQIAWASGYCVQQVRDLERLGVIPAALRGSNGYRHFSSAHITALRAYRRLAVAVGPVVARSTMQAALTLPRAEAVARIVALHVGLAQSRDDSIVAIQALDFIADEDSHDAPPTADDSMGITELAVAIGVRSSTLRFWEAQGLVTPERSAGLNARQYPLAAIREARIVAALRAGGYRIPAVQAVMQSLRTLSGNENFGAAEARVALQSRLDAIANQSIALLRASADIADLISE